MNKKKSLYSEMMVMTIVPILLLGIAITTLCAARFTETIYKQVETELKDISFAVLNTYDKIYPGNYSMVENDGHIEVYKGKNLINGNNEYLDCLKEDTGIDITIFYYNTRILTTLFDGDKRIVGTYANSVVEKDVLKNKKTKFYKSVYIEDEEYFAYYKPIYNVDNKCIGMIFTGKPVAEIKAEIYNNILPLIAVAVIAIILMAVLCFHYTKAIVRIIIKLQEFMGNISKGELSSQLDTSVLNRNDEIGMIGKSAVEMQKALKEFVEQDALTRINNRRCGEKLLNKTILEAKKTGITFSVAIGDIDWFKKVNDNYGHECGDFVLQEVAYILKKNIAGKGFVARWGGEEFLLVFYNHALESAAEILENMADEIRNTKICYEEYTITVTMTFGIVEGNCDKKEYKIIKEADDKLYSGKKSGRDRIIK